MRHELVCHPQSAAGSIARVVSSIRRSDDDGLAIAFVVEGDIGAIVLPQLMRRERTDGLWRSTCFEMFAAQSGNPAYLEFNVAPSNQWAAYAFDEYRHGQAELQGAALSRFDLQLVPDRLELSAVFNLTEPSREWIEADLHIGLSAVLECNDGQRSYWALTHCDPAKPDFHARDCFTALLRAPPPA